LPPEVRRRLAQLRQIAASRLRLIFVLLGVSVFSFMSTGLITRPESNEKFQELSYKTSATAAFRITLRGWLLDRSGKLENALALYRRDSSGNIYRDYPMDRAMAHIFGSDLGDPGLERALFGAQSGALPEALEVVRGRTVETGGQQRRTFDDRSRLATGCCRSVERKACAVVVLNPQTGEVLALYSEPSYSLKRSIARLPGSTRSQPASR